ncbi:hypothetical protein BDV29DRAFT_173061 [Aspergillus leporis]|uniref:Uncharacterized protein n=1 Tax=Aspergillus leporis TaxID=41062 RepID=A0A5N5X1V3_9EURO|nr:hypothetical protein BDV29DRAFT_173061 [Aspergillus leporis]
MTQYQSRSKIRIFSSYIASFGVLDSWFWTILAASDPVFRSFILPDLFLLPGSLLFPRFVSYSNIAPVDLYQKFQMSVAWRSSSETRIYRGRFFLSVLFSFITNSDTTFRLTRDTFFPRKYFCHFARKASEK